VYTIIRRLSGDDALAEDLAQEAWMRILRGLAGFRGESQLSSWIHQIAVNTALVGRQRERRQAARDQEYAAAPSRALVEEGKADQLMLRMQLELALEELPDGMRRVLVLHDIEGYTHEEIGEALGMAPSTSRSQLGRGRAKLRAVLTRGEPGRKP
jgi:RNA polymerase sigma-70 factor (ECF subfamily)